VCNPGLVLFGVHPALLDDAEANVDDVDIIHLAAGTAGVGGAGEKAKDEGIKPVSGVPVGGHALAVCLAVLGCCFAILFHESEEEVHKNNVWLAEAALLEEGAHLGRHRLEEDIGKGGVHCDNVCSCLFVTCMRCLHRCVVVVVNACGEVGYVGYLRREGHEGIGVCFR
jgi:hypothetical protein